jgi:ABC-type multidrug transport system fused ATPase/permease subunit
VDLTCAISVGGAVYAHYFRSGGWALCIWVLGLNLLQQTIRAMSDWWVSFWAKDQIATNPFQFYVWVYSIFLVGYGVALLVRSYSYAVFTMRASTNLHNGVFSRVLRAPMAFFDSTPLGRILNRFTKDQDNIDDVLPDAFEQATQSLLTVISGLIVIISVLWWFAIALIPIGAAFWFLGVYYRRTSREIKRLDGVTRSPIFAHLSATLNGLPTLRAYGVERTFELQNRLKIDVNTSMQYHFEVAARWLAVRLDFLSIIIVSGTAILTVAMKDVVPSALSALALSYALQTTGMMQWGVRMLAETENQMTSVERLMSYTQTLEQEGPGVVEENRPPEGWPVKPAIEYKKVELRYKPDLEPALKRVSFKIKAKEKIGIVGRTGAGKSTLAISLFRILEPSHGKILVDGVDVLKIGLDDLRSKLAIIPQDPVLFKNSVRYNLDPFGLYEDSALWQTLEKVFLRDVISSMPGQLDADVQENGSNFSAGQRQLICFARAVLRKSNILVLDEATASIDTETDERIQRTIRETFKKCTVLTIAHRLHTIIDSDRIMLLERGEVLELDAPANLLENPHSAFSKLVDETGFETSQYLRDVATGKVSFYSRRRTKKIPRLPGAPSTLNQ